ncbi:hypothetical protein DRJ17_03760 [Candidatus Woesearchaeota archaeon]|nr:MAG: hypothetical protein DRJ17_03760 [Candidatus Woesearchaeota archaeon]
MLELDKLDRDILYELSYNCRQPDSIIAKKLRKSKQVIRYRIRRLERDGIISAYNALIDFRVLGFSSIRIYFKLRNIDPTKEQEMYNEMRKNDLFLWTVNLEDDVDIAFYVWVKEIDKFYEKWEEFFLKYRKYIHRQEIYLSINMIHYPMKIFKKPGFVEVWDVGKNKNRVKIDKTDLAILKILSRYANKSIVEIARDVGISAKLAAYRIKQLEKKEIILAYNAIIDEKRIGYKMYKVDFYLFDHSKLTEMYEFARQHPNIKNLMKTIGGPDYEIEVLVKNVEELRNIINEIRSKFSDVIDYWRYNRFVETIKQVYLPIEVGL